MSLYSLLQEAMGTKGQSTLEKRIESRIVAVKNISTLKDVLAEKWEKLGLGFT
ncbi:hypothetical protein CU098_012550 [Rhizopus stolonifer]|uniref:Uncharacterized protein n=1 Tax=Rhizopus stolonifer TaxID=4846 RepID=A0A367KLT6_RHIST|nr:hypothetical protein CU098_012550 [Rhizopus stolonifer]